MSGRAMRVEEHAVRELSVTVPSWVGPDRPPEHVSLTAWPNGEGWTLAVSLDTSTQWAELSHEALDALVKLWRLAKRGGVAASG